MTIEMLDDAAKVATLCAYCPKMCRSTCTVADAEAREATTPWGKMSIVFGAHRGEVSLAERGNQKALEACTGCGACVENCAHGNPVAETLFLARGRAQSARAAQFRENFLATGDVKRRDLAATWSALPAKPGAKIAYFPGCTRLAQGADTIARDLEALRIATSTEVALVSGPAGCCGYPLYADGQLDVLADHLPRLVEPWREHQFVITPDPGCAYTLSVVREAVSEPASDLPQILPLVEVLAARAERFANRSAGLKVRYHDPCYLGRRGRTFSAPRKLIQAATGQVPLEFANHREQADCSGSGGLYPTSSPTGAKRVAERRIFEDGNAHIPIDAVVSACPSACRGLARTGAKVLDVVEIALGSSS